MRKVVLALQATLDSYQVPLEKRKVLVTLALSKGTAYSLALPTSPVESASQYYANTHRAVVEKLLSEINELFIIDYASCSDLIFKIWRMRYRMVYDVAALDVLAFLDGTLGENQREIPPVYRELANGCDCISVNELVKVLGELMKQSVEVDNVAG